MPRSHCESDTCILSPSGVESCSHYVTEGETRGISVGWKSCFGAVERIPHQHRLQGLSSSHPSLSSQGERPWERG